MLYVWNTDGEVGGVKSSGVLLLKLNLLTLLVALVSLD